MYIFKNKEILILICLTILIPRVQASTITLGNCFESLQVRLIKDGFNQILIKKLYHDPKVKFNSKGISLYFVHVEGQRNYEQFFDKKTIRKARAYMTKHSTDFKAAQKAFKVGPEIITAIILVETRFGKLLGRQPVLTTLSTMAALADERVRKIFWKVIEKNTKLTKKQYHKKANQKAEWAYLELKAYLKYTRKEKLKPTAIKGSFAGAMGICQFMPSNILKLAQDGNRDGHINLFQHADAIMSVASYFNHYGWKASLTGKKAYTVVFKYNHSKYYVNTILKIRKILKSKS